MAKLRRSEVPRDGADPPTNTSVCNLLTFSLSVHPAFLHRHVDHYYFGVEDFWFCIAPPPIVEVMLLSLCLHVANTHGRYPELATSASSNDGQAGVWDKVLLSRHRLSFLPFFLCSPTKANVSPTCISLQFHGLIYSPPALPGCSSNKSITFQRTMSSAYHGISFRINTILCAPYKVGVSLSVADNVFSTIPFWLPFDDNMIFNPNYKKKTVSFTCKNAAEKQEKKQAKSLDKGCVRHIDVS